MENLNTDKLEISVSPAWRVKAFFKHRLLQKFLFACPIVAKGLNFLGHHLIAAARLSKLESVERSASDRLASDGNGAQQMGSSYGYEDEITELANADKYRRQIISPKFMAAKNESAALYDHALARMSELFKKDHAIKSVLNFGVSYAHVDSELAKKFPEVKFTGIDRSRFTKMFNDSFFSNIPNLRILAGDIFELLKKERFDGGVFFHVRTLVLLPPSFIVQLYTAAAQAGFKYIVGMEQVGFSHQSFSLPDFSDDSRPSTLFRTNMYLHNYSALLKKANFAIKDQQLVKTNHPDPDFRIFSFVAEAIKR